jgi:hypothetical protein
MDEKFFVEEPFGLNGRGMWHVFVVDTTCVLAIAFVQDCLVGQVARVFYVLDEELVAIVLVVLIVQKGGHFVDALGYRLETEVRYDLF